MAGLYNILSKCDDALVAYVIAAGTGTTADVLPSRRSLKKTLPVTICRSRSAKPIQAYWTTYEVDASIQVRCLGIDDPAANQDGLPKISSDARVAATFDAFHRTTSRTSGEAIGDAITKAARDAGLNDLVIDDCAVTEIEAGFEAKGDGWVDIIHLRLVARSSSQT